MASCHATYWAFYADFAVLLSKGRDSMSRYSAQNYVTRGIGSSSCPFCDTTMDYGNNGLEERSCPECRPFYKADLAAKKLPPRIKETGTPFGFVRWAIIKRAEADGAEEGLPPEERRKLVSDIIEIWVGNYTTAQRALREQQVEADARRAAIASRSTY